MPGVRFLGATLWTDYAFYASVPVEDAMAVAEGSIFDHKMVRRQDGSIAPVIEHEGGHFRAATARQEHWKSRHWLERELAKPFDGTTVVVTHHGPHERSLHRKWEGQLSNGAFLSRMEPLVRQASLWVHGHVHSGFDYRVGSDPCHGRVLANPRGYVLNKQWANPVLATWENPQFDPRLVVSV